MRRSGFRCEGLPGPMWSLLRPLRANDCATAELAKQRAFAGSLLAAASCRVRLAIKLDKKQWLEGRLEEVRCGCQAGQTTALWGLARQLAGRKRRPCPALVAVLRQEDGTVIDSPTALAAAWQQTNLEECGGNGVVEGMCSDAEELTVRFQGHLP